MSRYPESPGYVKDSETSKAGAARTEPSAMAMRGTVEQYIRERGGATCDEVEVALGMRHQTASARIRELVLAERLIDTGDTRKTRSGSLARVYRAGKKEKQMTDFPSQYWRDALQKKFGQANVDSPETGYYRTSRGERVVFWNDSVTGEMRCQINGRDATVRAGETWNFINRRAVTEDAYYFHEANSRWPDQDSAVEQAKNAPSIDPEADPVGSIKEEIANAKAGLSDYIKIESDDAAGAAQTLRNLLNGLSTKADNKRTELKAPFLERGREIDAEWMPLVRDAKASADSLRKALTEWENVKRDNLRAAQIAAEAAAETTPGGTVPEPVSNTPAPSAQIRGAVGKAAAVTTIKTAEVDNWMAVAKHFIGNADVRALLQKLANAAVNAGITVPGTKVTEKADVR